VKELVSGYKVHLSGNLGGDKEDILPIEVIRGKKGRTIRGKMLNPLSSHPLGA